MRATAQRAVAIVSPFYYKLSPESVYAYYREIALNSPIDITLYNIPMYASPIDLATLRRLAELERVVAIKDSSGDLPSAMRMISAVRRERPDFVFLAGWDTLLVPMLLMGCDGATMASSGAAPELTLAIYDAVQAGRIEEAVRMQFRLLELCDTLFDSIDFPEGVRATIELRGFCFGRGRQPQTDKQRINLAALQDVLRRNLGDCPDFREEHSAPASGTHGRENGTVPFELESDNA